MSVAASWNFFAKSPPSVHTAKASTGISTSGATMSMPKITITMPSTGFHQRYVQVRSIRWYGRGSGCGKLGSAAGPG